MNFRELVCAALLASAAAGAPSTIAAAAIPAAAAAGRMPSLAPMIRRVSPAVVTIATQGEASSSDSRDDGGPSAEDPFYDRLFDPLPADGTYPITAAGSGVIVDARHGYILTNAHVVDHATAITVTLQDGRDLKARLVGIDPPSDLAVIRVHAPGLTQIRLGHSASLAVGDFVVAIGNPFGLPDSASAGIVSGLRRSGLSPDDYEDYIQTDASINPGNSGGALVDLRGDLVGINTAILSGGGGNIGIGFAIPVQIAARVMRQLIAHGEIRRGRLGVSLYPVTPEVARSLGLRRVAGGIVAQVVPGSPAARAGIRAGDVITALGRHPIRSNTDLLNAMGLMRVGDSVTLDVVHDGHSEQRHAVLANMLGD
jgi:Do/DeqQ family serine protease